MNLSTSNIRIQAAAGATLMASPDGGARRACMRSFGQTEVPD